MGGAIDGPEQPHAILSGEAQASSNQPGAGNTSNVMLTTPHP